jgi:hypothetical protein
MAATGSHSPLLGVPQEILQHITRYLKTPDYGNLRRTCSYIEAFLLGGFSREFFSKRQFMLTTFSLQALVDISKSRLSHSLRHVIFSVERPSPRDASNFPARVTPDVHAKRNRFRQEYIDHVALLDSGHDLEMMAEAFRNLPNLVTVEVRDFSSRSRFRDDPYTEWRSYGAPTYVRETGFNLEIPSMFRIPSLSDEQGLYTSRLFRGVLRALGDTPTRPTRFEVNLRHSALRDHAFNVPAYQEPAILPVLGSLKDLYLDVHTSFLPVVVGPAAEVCHTYLLRAFLSRVTQLEHLRLNFQACNPEHVRDFISWFSRTPSSDAAAPDPSSLLPETPPPVKFTNLRQLDIGKVMVEPKILLAVLQKYKATLRGIDFHRIELLDTNNSSERTCQWSRFFGNMSELDLGLNHMTMSSLGQMKDRSRGKRTITFRDCSEKDKHKRTWEGQDLPGALKDFKENVMVDWPERDTETERDNSPTSESDEDEDNENEDDDE